MHFIEILANAYAYCKAYKHYDMRRDLAQWKDALPVAALAHQNTLLYLQDESLPPSDRVLIAQAHNWHTAADYAAQQRLLQQPIGEDGDWRKWATSRRQIATHQWGAYRMNAAIFQVLPTDQGLELWLNGDYWTVGAPERGHFKIAQLRPHETVGVKIDGMRDFSATGRRDRIFLEQEYRITYHGEIPQQAAATQPLVRAVPTPHMTVDLLRHVR